MPGASKIASKEACRFSQHWLVACCVWLSKGGVGIHTDTSSLQLTHTDHDKVCKLLESHEKAFIVGADNVGSMQFQQIRRVSQPAGSGRGVWGLVQ